MLRENLQHRHELDAQSLKVLILTQIEFITSRVSGRGNIFSSVCVCACVSVCTSLSVLQAEPLDLQT